MTGCESMNGTSLSMRMARSPAERLILEIKCG